MQNFLNPKMLLPVVAALFYPYANNEHLGGIQQTLLGICYPGPRGFLSPQRDETRERKKWREKTSGSGRCESHYHATIGVNQHHEID